MTYTSPFGTVTARSQVEQAVVSLLQTPPTGGDSPLIVYYLAEVERQLGLPPRTIPPPEGPESYRGGLDFETWKDDDLPLLIVLAQPTGSATRLDNAGDYVQSYQIQVAAVVESSDGDQDAVRGLADQYGAAVMLLLLQNGALGTRATADGDIVPVSTTTVLTSAPRTELLDVTNRRFARSVTVVESLVANLASEGGPTSFEPDPYDPPGTWPTVEQTNVTVTAEPLP